MGLSNAAPLSSVSLPMARSAAIAIVMLAVVPLTVRPASAQEKKPADGPKAAPVVVTEVVERELAEGQTLVGTVMPARRSTIGSAVDGRVVESSIKRGQAVRKGQPLAKLRTTQLEISLRAARAELATRAAALAELRNGPRPEEIAQAAGEMAAANATRTSSKSRHERAKTLHSRKAMNDEQFQEVVASYERARATYAAAEAKYNLLKSGTRPEQIAASEARLDFQSEQVKLIEEQITRHTMTAPFDGYISQEHTEVGQWLGRGDPVAEVIELAAVEVEVFVLEKYLANLTTGVSVQVAVPSVPSEFFPGVIANIVPQADLRSRSFPVRIRIKNTIEAAGPVLKAGMLARAQLPLGKRGLTKLVDKDAVVFGGREPLVYVLDRKLAVSGEGPVRAVPVRLGVMDGDLIEVTGELNPGNQIVIRGNERLANGQSVIVTEIRSVSRVSTAVKKPKATASPGGIGS